MFRSDRSGDSWGQERVRFESYLVICWALDSGVNIKVFGNVLFLFWLLLVGFLCVPVLSTTEIRVSLPIPAGSCQSYVKQN